MNSVTAIRPAAASKFEVTCSSCNLRELCLPAGLCAEDLERV
jgi:CRP/FNR family transcriptional regulator, anaerobic regulatory protein